MRVQTGSHLLRSRALISPLGLLLVFVLGGCGAGSTYLRYLTVTPGRTSIAMGQTAKFAVIATYSNDKTVDVSDSVTWSALDPSIVSLVAGGTATPKALGTTNVVATLTGSSGSATIEVTKAALTGISIDAPAGPVAVGLTAQLKATGTYTDKSVADITSQVTWTAAQPDVLAVSTTGMAVAKSAGTTQVTASLNSINASAGVTVSPAALTGIAVFSKAPTLPIGSTEQLSAIGSYTDGSNADLTGKVAWTSSSPAAISLSATGMASAKAVGTAAITASLAGIAGTTSLSASDAALVSMAVTGTRSSLPLGITGQMTATGTYTDGSTRDLTGSATWASSSPGVVSVSSSGLILARSTGTAGISATASNITASAAVSATEAELVSLTVSSNAATLPLGATLQLTATGTYTDASTRDLTGTASWTSSSPDIVSINSPGLVAGMAVGSAVVTATSGTISGVNELAVSNPAIASLTLAPAAPTLALGSTLQMAVTGIYSDGTSQDVTSQIAWAVDDPTIASIDNNGVINGLQIGTTDIHASINGVDSSATLTVLPALAVGYYDATSGADSTIRITNPALTGQDLCTLIYVFDQSQQLSECCGCMVSQDGLLTLSLTKNLLSNPLTGVPSTAGTILLVSAQPAMNSACNASSATPAGKVIAWSTRLPTSKAGLTSTGEETFSTSPLTPADAAALQAQCSFVQQLGSGQGLCGCGGSQY